MKIFTSALSSILLFSFVSVAQIHNPDFDDWTNGEPNEWVTNNAPPDYIGITQTTDNYTAALAVHGQVLPLFTIAFAPSLNAGSDGRGFPIVDLKPTSLEGYYKFTSVSEDQFLVSVLLTKNSDLIGAASLPLTSADSYTRFSASIIYYTDEFPDTTYISFSVINSAGFSHVGSEFFLDHLFWSTTTDVNNTGENVPDKFDLGQNYPNPFNPSTKIKYTIPNVGASLMKPVQLKVCDVLGNEVATLVNEEKPAGNYEVEFNSKGLPSGVYFYTLQAGSYTKTMKMLLLK